MDIDLKEAKKNDCELLYTWVNDKIVRNNSFNSNYIEYKTHREWFEKKLSSYNTLIYIAYLQNAPIGQIRIDIEDGIGLINYSIQTTYRGNGYGTNLLKTTIELLKNNSNLNMIVGKVKVNNIASQRAFKNAGFVSNSKEDIIEYYYNLE